jgi:hypothetical protein
VNEDQMLAELAAIDEPSDADEIDVEHVDPEETGLDEAPEAEGDDTLVQEVTA